MTAVKLQKKLALPNPRTAKERLFHSVNIMLADAIHQGVTIKGLRILMGVHYLQRRREEVYVGEIHAIYYEITRDVSWSYESCRAMCNTLSKDGWLEKHKLDGYVAYTLTQKTKDAFGL